MPALTSTSDRLGRSLVLSAESETTEIIRRRLFQWNAQDISQGRERDDLERQLFQERLKSIEPERIVNVVRLWRGEALEVGIDDRQEYPYGYSENAVTPGCHLPPRRSTSNKHQPLPA